MAVEPVVAGDEVLNKTGQLRYLLPPDTTLSLVERVRDLTLCPFQADFEFVQLTPREMAFVLKPADDNTRGNALSGSECTNRLLFARTTCNKSRPFSLRHQLVCCPFIRFRFEVCDLALLCAIDKYVFLAVQKNMCGLVEQAKPQMVVCLVACAQLDYGLPGRKPPRRTAKGCFRQRLDQSQGNARSIAELSGVG